MVIGECTGVSGEQLGFDCRPRKSGGFRWNCTDYPDICGATVPQADGTFLCYSWVHTMYSTNAAPTIGRFSNPVQGMVRMAQAVADMW